MIKAENDITLVRVDDGAMGPQGEQGIPGTNGTDGKTPYLHIAYANSADGTYGFSVSDSTGKLYIGQYTDFVQADSTDPSKYAWTKIKGEPGANGSDGEDAALLRIESSRGTVFKNDQVSTVLSAVIYKGSQRITDSTEMKATFGSGAYLQWKWLRLEDESYGVISATDSRFSNDGFTFTLSPDDVDTKVTFICELIV